MPHSWLETEGWQMERGPFSGCVIATGGRLVAALMGLKPISIHVVHEGQISVEVCCETKALEDGCLGLQLPAKAEQADGHNMHLKKDCGNG